jgi:signal transduction histidine kinase
VNNAIKHSSADRLVLTFIQSGSFLELEISDNGLLTEVSTIENKGSGVGNFRKRTGRHRGSVKFSVGHEGHGLTILFRFLLGADPVLKSALG